jgi:hypothetical protein
MLDTASSESAAAPHVQAAASCEECAGSGGWFRYDPALEPTPGLLYLSCVHCRGTGRTDASLSQLLRIG